MKEAHKMYKDLGNEILNGTLSFKKFTDLFRNKNSNKDFEVIMDFVGMTGKNKSERLEQLIIYKSLDAIKMIVKVLLEIKEKNELTENFDILKEMDESVNKIKKLIMLLKRSFLLNFFNSYRAMITTTNHSMKSIRKP